MQNTTMIFLTFFVLLSFSCQTTEVKSAQSDENKKSKILQNKKPKTRQNKSIANKKRTTTKDKKPKSSKPKKNKKPKAKYLELLAKELKLNAFQKAAVRKIHIDVKTKKKQISKLFKIKKSKEEQLAQINHK